MLQIYAIGEKNFKLKLRVKTSLVLTYLGPLIGLILPLITMGQLFTFTTNFGPWDETNFFIYQLIAYKLGIVFGLMNTFSSQLSVEKYWKTLPALIIAPFRRMYLLLGIYLSFLMVSMVPFTITFTICYIYYPISIYTVFSMLFVYFCVSMIFTGVGLIIGIGAISKENVIPIISFGISFIFMFSCISLPFEFFPKYFQNIVVLNPLYYIIDFVRLVWIEDNFIYSILMHPFHFFWVIFGAILLPILGLIIFNYIYKKYGIVGY